MNATPVIIEAAINGGTPKRRNPHVPRSIDEIVDNALACIDAGAAIVHNHNDEPVNGTPVHAAGPYLAAYARIRERRPDAILYPTMGSGTLGGAAHVSMAERYAHVDELAKAGHLRMGLIDPGSVDLGGLDGDGLPAAIDAVYVNTYADVRHMVERCAAHRLGPSVSIFEPGFLRLALAYHARGALPRGALIKLYFGGGTPGFGLPPTAPSLAAYLALLDGTGLPWSVAVLGGDVLGTIAEEAVRRGGHLRVGLEDYGGPRTPTNVELVQEAVALIRRLGRRPATISEAAELLGLQR
ncbi:MAG TPA: 3-keto-5-aminohexanoate cleavage protein [Dehalococcoidia bacterium]|nr:3-keto-5-aminohexanoate cleavage protein [Dehalococcoidia bacterium]